MTGKVLEVGPRRPIFAGGWSAQVTLRGVQYNCAVERGKSVRIPFMPRGRSRGWQWWGTVRRREDARAVFYGRVPKSIGARGLLKAARLIGEGIQG